MLGQGLTIPTLAARQAAAGLELNFIAGRYLVQGGGFSTLVGTSGVSFARASSGLAETASGVLVPFGSGLPRLTDRGLLIEEARSNKVTIHNANPVDLTGVTRSGDAASILSLVSDAAALAAAGLASVVTGGQVFKLDNSAGVTTAFATFAGATGNTNPHRATLYVRGGTGVVAMAGSGSAAFSASAGYVRRETAMTPDTAARTFYVRADAGQVVHFILPMLEEGGFATSPIVTQGAATTRAADVCSVSGLATLLVAPYAVVAHADLPSADGVNRRLVTINALGSETGRISLVRDGSNQAGASPNPGNPSVVTGKTGARILRIAAQVGADKARAAVDGVPAADPAAVSLGTGQDRIALGSAATGAASWLGGYLQSVRIVPGVMLDADLTAASVA